MEAPLLHAHERKHRAQRHEPAERLDWTILHSNFISNTAGVFWMENWVSLPWKAEAGVRYDVRKLRSFRNDGEAITETTRNFSHLSWSGGIGWQQERLSLSFNSGSAWRSPSINGVCSGTTPWRCGS